MELRSLVHWSGSVVAGGREKRREVLVALGACLQPGPGGKPSLAYALQDGEGSDVVVL